MMEPKPTSAIQPVEHELDGARTANENSQETGEDLICYPSGIQFASIIFATLSSVFLSSLVSLLPNILAPLDLC